MATNNITIPKKEIAPGVFTTGGTATMPNNVITPQNLAPETPTQLSKTQPDTTNYGGVIGGVGESIANDLNFLTGKVNTQEQNLAQGQNDISSLIRNISGQGNELLAEQDRQGVNTETEKYNSLQQTLLDLQGQATSLNREAQAIPLQVQAENKNQLATSQRTDVVTTERLRDNALRALSIAQQSDIAFATATGSQIRLKAAQDKANQIVEMKYAPLKAELEIKKQNYEFNKDILERFDKKRAEALGIALKKEEREIEKAEENEKAIEKMLLDATPNAPANIIASANAVKQRGGSALEVAQALGKYGGDYLKTELLKQQIETEKAQRSKIYTDIAKTKRETGLLGQPVGVDGVIATLPKSSQERYYKLQGDFDTATKNYRGAIDSAGSITALSKDATPQQQTAIIFQYMKTLDPSSTVREGEFALVGNTAGLGDRAVNALRKLDKGSRLNENQINDIVGATKVLAENAKKNLELTSNEYDRRAVKFGLPKGLFYEEQEMASNTSPEAEAIRAKIKAANPNIGVEKIQGTEIIQNINNGVTSFILPTNPKKN